MHEVILALLKFPILTTNHIHVYIKLPRCPQHSTQLAMTKLYITFVRPMIDQAAICKPAVANGSLYAHC